MCTKLELYDGDVLLSFPSIQVWDDPSIGFFFLSNELKCVPLFLSNTQENCVSLY
jgi:hypothetical protein